ncbi:MAG: SufS family cysteine desulfurase [Rikenellaceae bacterium]
MFDVQKVREDFPLISETKIYGKPLIYFDSAATAQKPQCVIDKIDYMHKELNSNIHRGVHYMSEMATSEYENAREKVRAFINAEHSSEIVFTSGATASLNTVAYSFSEKYFKSGGNVILSEMEHHSNIVPWQICAQRKGVEIRVLPVDDSGELMIEKLDELIDENTHIVSVSQCSNVLGTQADIAQICRIAHSKNVPVTVDGCQGIVHSWADVRAMDCDFYAFSAHKLYGPTGSGVLYGKKKFLDELPPFFGGGEMIDTVSFSGTTYAKAPLKFEAGTPNYIGAIGLGAAIDYLNSFDKAEIHAHEKMLLDYATQQISKIEDLEIYGTTENKCSIISFNVKGLHAYDIGMILDKLAIAIRTGNHCAEPLMNRFGINGTCRASFAMYNTMQEIDEFIKALDRAVKMLK